MWKMIITKEFFYLDVQADADIDIEVNFDFQDEFMDKS